MKIVFLDFDGVLNSHAYIRTLDEKARKGVVGLERAAVERLNRLLDHTGAHIVVSSTWRHNRTPEQLAELLHEAGFVYRSKVIGRTPRWLSKSPGGIYAADSRGHEIQAWLDGADDYGITVDAFVILDDDSDMAHLADRLVKTSFDDGLQDQHVEEAIRLLNGALQKKGNT